MFVDRLPLYAELEKAYECRVVSLITGDRKNVPTQIAGDARELLARHLDVIGPTKRIALFLYTRGGNTLSAWSMANLLHRFCDELYVLIPSKALSAGTLISLAADRIVMTKQATLGPIDPSVTTPLNPINPSNHEQRVPVNVEEINGYVEFAKSVVGDNQDALAIALQKLTEQVHPLVLGMAWRSRSQIRMLAGRLISRSIKDSDKVEKILKFLCSESGSHDYSIDRREAREELGLVIENPDDPQYVLIRDIYNDMVTELKLLEPYDDKLEMGANNPHSYSLRRALVESPAGGCHCYLTEGILKSHILPPNPPGQPIEQEVIGGLRTFEGWKHVA